MKFAYPTWVMGRYACVVFAEIDEFLVTDPDLYPGGLRQYMQHFANEDTRDGRERSPHRSPKAPKAKAMAKAPDAAHHRMNVRVCVGS